MPHTPYPLICHAKAERRLGRALIGRRLAAAMTLAAITLASGVAPSPAATAAPPAVTQSPAPIQPSTPLAIPPFETVPSPSASPSPAAPEPQPAPAAIPSAAATPGVEPSPAATTPAPQPEGSPTAPTVPPAATLAEPEPDSAEAPPISLSLDDPAAADDVPEPALLPSSAVGESVIAQGWPWLAAGLLAILAGLGLMIALRRRKPKVLRLAAAPLAAEGKPAKGEAAPIRLDTILDIVSASRSLMMFTLEYRLEIANRSPRAVREVAVTTRLGYPGRTGEEAALVASAEDIQTIERIGPQQSRSVTGTLRLPLSEIAPIRQGAAPLLIPLLHVLIEAADRAANKRVFVAGPPSPQNMGRLQPIRLDGPPGGIAGIRALPVNAP